MTGFKSRLTLGAMLVVGTCALAGCVDYAPQPTPASSTTTTESTTTQPMPAPVIVGQPAATTTVTTSGPAQ